MKKGVNKIENQGEQNASKLSNEFLVKIRPILGPIISRTKYDRNKPFFQQKESVNKTELGIKRGPKEI